MRAYAATGNTSYLLRAVAVFDYVVANGWSSLCGGGIVWCPKPYVTAISSFILVTGCFSRHNYLATITNCFGLQNEPV